MFDWLKSQFVKKEPVKDRVLVEKAKRGDAEAFGQLYLKYLAGIYRYFYFRIGQDRSVAEDLAQQVFFKAWEALPTYRERGWRFSTWLYTIAHNLLVDSYRKKKEETRLSDFYPSEEDKSLERIVREEEYDILKRAVSILTDDQKQVILLKFVEDFGNREISAITGKREEAIRALQHRAIAKLREILEKENGI